MHGPLPSMGRTSFLGYADSPYSNQPDQDVHAQDQRHDRRIRSMDFSRRRAAPDLPARCKRRCTRHPQGMLARRAIDFWRDSNSGARTYAAAHRSAPGRRSASTTTKRTWRSKFGRILTTTRQSRGDAVSISASAAARSSRECCCTQSAISFERQIGGATSAMSNPRPRCGPIANNRRDRADDGYLQRHRRMTDGEHELRPDAMPVPRAQMPAAHGP